MVSVMSQVADLFHIPSFRNSRLHSSERIPLMNHNASVERYGQQRIAKDPEAINSLIRYLEPGVQYQKHYLTKPDVNTGDTKTGLVHFVGLEDVPMGDWDWRGASHPTGDPQIESLGEAYDRLDKYTTDNPDSRWQVYLTPGGVRSWEVGRRVTPEQFRNEGSFNEDHLNIDPMYAAITVQGRLAPQYPKETNPAFWSRISGKPGRPDDFVAYPLNTIGRGDIDPYNARLIQEYHDKPIQQVLAKEGINPHKAALELLNKHLATVPRKWAIPVEQRLERQGLI